MKLFAFLLSMFVAGAAVGGVSNPPNIPIPANPVGWCTATQLVPGTVRTTQIGDCPAPPPDTCPAGRITSMYLAVGSYTGGGRKLVDVTTADNVFGYYTWNSSRLSYPWKNDYTILEYPRTVGAYTASKFTVPLTTPNNQWGIFGKLATLPGPQFDFSISTRCGDFSPAAQQCFALQQFNNGNMLGDRLPGYPAPSLCPLVPGGTYYINGRLSNPTTSVTNCTNNICKVGIQRNHTP
jgi:hypothetical protein